MKKMVLLVLAASVLVFMWAVPALAAEVEMTVIGEVTDNYQIVTDLGEIYEVADTDMGNDLLNYVGKKVEATGTVTDEDGVKTIKVAAYVVLEE